MGRRITRIYGVWCFGPVLGARQVVGGDWLRRDGDIVGLQGKRAAMDRAAHEFGFATYTEAKRKGWCEVRLIGRMP